MTSNEDESNDAVLSDVEDEDPVPIEVASSSPEDVSVEKFRAILSELERERREREAAETAKSELQVSFNRLKVLAHEAIRKRDETNRVKDEAIRERDEAVRERDEVKRERDEVKRERDEAVRENEKLRVELEELGRVKNEVSEKCEAVRGEIETGARMLMNGIEKISGKVSGFRDFSGGGLPRSQKYSGLPAVAYGVIKRTNEIVEEMIRQVEVIRKERDEVREQMEQRNYEIAIEVSQLEATIDGLKEEVGKKGSVVEGLEKLVSEKDGKLGDLEKVMLEKQGLADIKLARLRGLVDESEGKLKDLEMKMDSQRPLLVEQLKYVARIHEQIDNVIKIVEGNKLDQSELSESLFLPKETDMEENVRASLAGMESIYELSRNVVEKTRELVEERSIEVKRLNDTVSQLVKEKEHIGTLLRSALSKRVSADLSSKTNELFKVAENGLKEAGIDYNFSNHMGDGKELPINDKEDEIYTLAGALENIIKQSQLEIIELKHTVDEFRAEADLLRQHVEAQGKELIQRKQKLEELEEKERVANENVEGLMMDIAVAEEEITRWKVAAQQEADAGKAVEQDFMAQLLVFRQELEEAKQAVIESEKKLKFKEETANAAMAARDAAEKSLRLADLRSSRLRDRVEELTRQLETHETSRSVSSRPRYACWPWEWLGLNFVGSHQPLTHQESSNEMELSEPLI